MLFHINCTDNEYVFVKAHTNQLHYTNQCEVVREMGNDWAVCRRRCNWCENWNYPSSRFVMRFIHLFKGPKVRFWARLIIIIWHITNMSRVSETLCFIWTAIPYKQPLSVWFENSNDFIVTYSNYIPTKQTQNQNTVKSFMIMICRIQCLEKKSLD